MAKRSLVTVITTAWRVGHDPPLGEGLFFLDTFKIGLHHVFLPVSGEGTVEMPDWFLAEGVTRFAEDSPQANAQPPSR